MSFKETPIILNKETAKEEEIKKEEIIEGAQEGAQEEVKEEEEIKEEEIKKEEIIEGAQEEVKEEKKIKEEEIKERAQEEMKEEEIKDEEITEGAQEEVKEEEKIKEEEEIKEEEIKEEEVIEEVKKPKKAKEEIEIVSRKYYKLEDKLIIAFSEFWADKHEEKSIALKNKVDALDSKINTIREAKREIETIIEEYKSEKLPGVESLQLKVKKMEREERDLLNKKDKAQSEIEARGDKIKLYINERDRAVNRFIERYNEKLEPMEEKLKILETNKDEVNLLIAVAEIRNKRFVEEIDNIKERKIKIEEAFRKIGLSERKIKKDKALIFLSERLKELDKKIKTSEDALSEKKELINKKVAEIDAKANRYRDKKEEYLRIKEGRPIEIVLEEREESPDFQEEEEIISRPRKKQPEGLRKREGEITEGREKLTIQNYISLWDSYLSNKYNQALADEERINSGDFSKLTGLSTEYQLGFEDFKNVLELYYKLKKMPTEKFYINIDSFSKEEIETKK